MLQAAFSIKHKYALTNGYEKGKLVERRGRKAKSPFHMLIFTFSIE